MLGEELRTPLKPVPNQPRWGFRLFAQDEHAVDPDVEEPLVRLPAIRPKTTDV